LDLLYPSEYGIKMKLDLLDDESLWAYPSDEAESFDWSPVSLEDSDIFRDSPAKSTSHVPTDGGVQLTQRDKPRGPLL